MIEKMKFLSITGPKADIDRVVNTYLSKYEIHLENALSELTTVETLTPFLEINPYREALSTAESFYQELDSPEKITPRSMNLETAIAALRKIEEQQAQSQEIRTDLEEQLRKLTEGLRIIRPFRNIDYNISTILDFQFIKYRFGRIEKQYFEKFKTYIYDNLDTIFIKCDDDSEYIWGLYFVPEHEAHKIDAVYSSMHFERSLLPERYKGTAHQEFEEIDNKLADVQKRLNKEKDAWKSYLEKEAVNIVSAKAALDEFSQLFDVRKLAACTHGDKENFYILCGWMSARDAKAFSKEVEDDKQLFCIIENSENDVKRKPPTKLKNIKLFKPFEMYTKMYGIPCYGEMDPTWFLAITYSFIFGAMFGDVGQGLLLFFGGLFLYKVKHMDLAGIIACAGVFSTFFGFMYGSLFGFEDILHAYWLKPMSAMMDVPLVGRLNTVFVVAIGLGMLLILVCMIFNIVNSFRSHDVEKTWFDSNAVAGLVFYGSVVLVAALFVSGRKLPAAAVLGIMFGIPLLLIFLKEPLTNLVKHKAHIFPEQKGMFFVQSFFELFEVLLSYLSNTLSFLRIGAFAVSHAAMMEVVLMLAGATEGGSPNWVVIILGNLFVSAMEGLIVGIQVLRLEYYEIFSRFYNGSGREFKPFLKKQPGIKSR